MGKRPRHVPQRTCCACREKTDKRRLTRIVRTPDAGVVVDPTGKQNGRGAYLCGKPACWEKGISGTVLEQALNTELTPEARERLALHRPVAEP